MTIPNLLRTSLLAPLFLLSLGTGLRAGTIYTSESSFASALSPGYYRETYQSYSLGGGKGVSGGSFQYTATTTAQAFLVFDLSGNNYLTTSGKQTTGWSAPITITFTGAPVYAVGGAFFYTTAGGAVTGGTVGLAINGADGTTQSLTNQSNSTFFGYVSSSPITSLVFTPDATNHFSSIDNLYVGTAATAAPEPSTLLSLASAAALALCVHLRRRISKQS